MSRLDSKVKKIILPITTLGYQSIYYHSIDKRVNESIVIIPITEAEEKSLDSGELRVDKGNQRFTITKSELICYGEIDLSTNSDDYKVIENMKWLDSLGFQGLCIPSDYDYNEHACYSPTGRLRYYETWNPAVAAQYRHGCLGKPKRCCIFKQRSYG